MEDIGDTEKFYLEVQQKLGGTIPWASLPTHVQYAFVDALNNLLSICSWKD